MDQNSQLDDELKRKRQLANARLKKYRNKKRQEAQQQYLVSQNAPNKQSNEQIQQNKLERRRELARERSKRYRDKKRQSNEQIQKNKLERQRELAREHSRRYHDKKQQNNEQIQQNKLERQRELAREHSRRYRDKKRQSNEQIQQKIQNKLECQRELAREYSKRYCDKKRQIHEQIQQKIQQNKLEQQRELAREYSRRYRAKKQLCTMKTLEHDLQIPGPSSCSPPLLIESHRTPIHNLQIPGTSTNMNIPLVVNDYSENVNNSEKSYVGPSQEENLVTQENQQNYLSPHDKENQQIEIDDNLVPLEDQQHTSPAASLQPYRSSMTYSSYTRHNSALTEFHEQFTQDSFGHACKICDRLWFKNDLKNLNDENLKFVMRFLPNVDEHSIAVCSTCQTSIQKKLCVLFIMYFA